MDALPSEELREVAQLKFEGYTRDEIGERLTIAKRTVGRRLALIREIWQDLLGANGSGDP